MLFVLPTRRAWTTLDDVVEQRFSRDAPDLRGDGTNEVLPRTRALHSIVAAAWDRMVPSRCCRHDHFTSSG
jgi:hypothetical protein